MRIRHILSVNLFVADLEAARAFYEDGLVLPVGRTTDELITFYTGDTQFNLMPGTGDNAGLVGRETGITLRMRGEGDLARMIQRLRDKGYAPSDRDFGPLRRGHRLHLSDPSNNRLTLFEDEGGMDDLSYFDGPSSVTLKVKDLRRSLSFYLTVLELPMLEQPSPDTAVLLPGGTNLVLAASNRWAAATPITGETGLVFVVDDVPAAIDHLQGNRIPFAEPPQTAGGAMVLAIRDPDGNVLTLMGPS